jgi:hypothetical protein
VALVGGDEPHTVARLDLDQRRLEHHRAFGALVEHLDLDLGRSRRRGECQRRDGAE